MNKRIEINVRGNVQGIFFRQKTKELAKKLNITGYAKNESDRSVVIVAEGELEKLYELLTWVRKGPKDSQVEMCTEKWKTATEEFLNFRVL